MKIKSTHNWSRRDFSAILECDACGHEQEQKSCYDDRNYYDNVIPKIACEKCGVKGTDDKPETKYPANLTI